MEKKTHTIPSKLEPTVQFTLCYDHVPTTAMQWKTQITPMDHLEDAGLYVTLTHIKLSRRHPHGQRHYAI